MFPQPPQPILFTSQKDTSEQVPTFAMYACKGCLLIPMLPDGPVHTGGKTGAS